MFFDCEVQPILCFWEVLVVLLTVKCLCSVQVVYIATSFLSVHHLYLEVWVKLSSSLVRHDNIWYCLPTRETRVLINIFVCRMYLFFKKIRLKKNFYPVPNVVYHLDKENLSPAWLPGRLKQCHFTCQLEKLESLMFKRIYPILLLVSCSQSFLSLGKGEHTSHNSSWLLGHLNRCDVVCQLKEPESLWRSLIVKRICSVHLLVLCSSSFSSIAEGELKPRNSLWIVITFPSEAKWACLPALNLSLCLWNLVP